MKSRSMPIQWLLRSVGLAVAYFVVARGALLLPVPPGFATPVWPAAGVAIAGILVFGYRVWPGIFIGSFLVTAPLLLDATSSETFVGAVWPSTGIAGGAVLQALLGAFLVRRLVGFPSDFDRPGAIVKTMALGGPVACLTGATLGTASLVVAGVVITGNVFLHWGTWWIGDTVGVLILIPLVSLWATELRRTSTRMRLFVALPLVVMAALTAVTSLLVRNDELQKTRMEFERRAELMARTLEPTANGHLDIVQSVASLFESSDDVTREDFRTFVKPIFKRHPDLHGLSWNAIVSFDERAGFEERTRLDGYPEFRVTERDSSGALVAAGVRDRYVIVHFIEPYEGNEQALGYDLASDPVREQTLERARDNGHIAATPPILLVQETEHKPGFLLFAPVYVRGAPRATPDQRRQSLRSYVSGVFKAEPMVVDALWTFAGEGIDYEVIDTTDPDQPYMLYDGGSGSSHQSSLLTGLDWSTDFDLAGRRWTVRLWPAPGYDAPADWAKVWVVLAGGLLFTALLGALFLVVAGRTAASERANEVLRHEIEERLEVEAALRASQEQVQQSQKLESLGVLAGGIAHDFNNLLMGVLGHADLALGKLTPSASARTNIQNIQLASQRAAELANQLLAYSGRASFTIEIIDLSELVVETSALADVSPSKVARVTYNLGRDLPPVKADSTQMRQVVLNLITNALEAIGDTGGTVTLTTGAVECDSEYLSRTFAATGLAEGTYSFVEVADTGCGMDEETQKRIFDPFFTTKFTGRGLGLAAVLGIVRGHDGAVDLKSEPGHGTTIRVLLPASGEPVARNEDPEPLAHEWKGEGTVLLVDDDPTVRTVVTEMLKSIGFTVVLANDGVEAVDTYRQRAEEISLVLLDLAMPRMDGEETFEELRTIRRDAKVIMSSGYDELETMTRFSGKGLAGFIHKPYRLAPLRDVLRAVLDT